MDYFASKELVEFFTKHGFKETTKSLYPDHYELMENRGVYDPGSIKRSFRKGRFVIVFDYINIFAYYNSSSPFWRGTKLTFESLKSILFIANLNPTDRVYLKNKSGLVNLDEFLNHNKYFVLETSSTKKKVIHFKESFSNFSI